MAKPLNKTLVGLFVVGAVILAVAAIVLLGSGRFLEKRPKYVMFFSGSVHGLTIGAPVEFRGVKIGEVTAISADFNPKDLSVVIPVYAEYDPRSLTVPANLRKFVESGEYPYLKRMIGKGLKAQLRMKSMLTGQLYIAVDFYPEKPITLVGLEKRYPEIPTIPSTADVVMATLEKLPVSEISDRLLKVTEGIEKIVNSPDVANSLKSLNLAMGHMNGLLSEIDAEVKPMITSVKATSEAARGAFAQAEKTLAMKEGESGKIAEKLQQTLARADTALEEMRSTLASFNKIAQKNTDIGYDISKSLREIEKASRSIRSLSDYLERHPEAIVKGKKAAGGE